MRILRRWLCGVVCGAWALAGSASAENFYVDNLNGRDINDGLTQVPLNALTGPVRSINRALQLAGSGDTISIANTGRPYYESLALVGHRLGGVQHVPFTILGNGATLSGLRQLPRSGWRRVTPELWQVSFTRKGFYRILRNGLSAPEFRPDSQEGILESLPPGQWCVWKGSIYFRQDSIVEPPEERFDFAADEVGITLYQVEHVRIVDLKIEHFRLDGIHAQNMCQAIELEGITSRENGRAGLAVGGSSSVMFLAGRLSKNGRHSALITGRGRLEIEASRLDARPTAE